MQLHSALCLLLAAVKVIQGQTLSNVIKNDTALSQLSAFFANYSSLAKSVSNLSGITFLAPNNEAFANLMADRLGFDRLRNDSAMMEALFGYHVLPRPYPDFKFITGLSAVLDTSLNSPVFSSVNDYQPVVVYPQPAGLNNNGSARYVSGLNLTSTSHGNPIAFGKNANGSSYIHVIDRFLTIPENFVSTAMSFRGFNLSNAIAAFDQANLSASLVSQPDLTFFLPTNEAFDAFGPLNANRSVSEVADLLKYHIISGNMLYNTTIIDDTSVTALSGNDVHFWTSTDKSDIYVNYAHVVAVDLLVSNGVIHIIDSVLDPRNATTAPIHLPTPSDFNTAEMASTATFKISTTSGGPQTVEVTSNTGTSSDTVVRTDVTTITSPPVTVSSKTSHGMAVGTKMEGVMDLGGFLGAAGAFMFVL